MQILRNQNNEILLVTPTTFFQHPKNLLQTMTTADLQKQLLVHVMKGLQSIDILRGLELAKDRDNEEMDADINLMGYATVQAFERGQRQAIKKMGEAELLKYLALQTLVKNATVMDEESWTNFKMEGFFFDSAGKCVIFNSR